MGEPLIPIGRPPAEQAMSISAAMRQAAIDASTLPPGVHLSAEWDDRKACAVVTIRKGNAYGAVVATWDYQQGRRVAVHGGVTW